jgi:hypothetical protein
VGTFTIAYKLAKKLFYDTPTPTSPVFVSKLDDNKSLFTVPLYLRDGKFHVGGTVVSPEATKKLEEQIQTALGKLPSGAFANTPMTLFVVSNKEQTSFERVFIGGRRENEVLVAGQINLDPRENPSGAFQLIEGKDQKDVRVELMGSDNIAPPTKEGLRQIKAMIDSGDLVKAGPQKEEHEVTLAQMQESAPRTPAVPPRFNTVPALA